MGERGSRTPLLRKRLFTQGAAAPRSALGVPESSDELTRDPKEKRPAHEAVRPEEISTALGEQARDVQSALDTIPITLHRRVVDIYFEPMVLGALPSEPMSIELVRCRFSNNLQVPVHCGQACHFTWDGAAQAASIASIDGLDPSEPIEYEFLFRVTYPPDVEVL